MKRKTTMGVSEKKIVYSAASAARALTKHCLFSSKILNLATIYLLLFYHGKCFQAIYTLSISTSLATLLAELIMT